LVVWQIVLAATAGAVLTAWFAAEWMQAMSNDSLKKSSRVLLILVGSKMLFFDLRVRQNGPLAAYFAQQSTDGLAHLAAAGFVHLAAAGLLHFAEAGLAQAA